MKSSVNIGYHIDELKTGFATRIVRYTTRRDARSPSRRARLRRVFFLARSFLAGVLQHLPPAWRMTLRRIPLRAMSSPPPSPPPMVYHTLDRSLFSRVLPLLGVRMPATSTAAVSRLLSRQTLALPRVRPVVSPAEEPAIRILLLAPAPAGAGAAPAARSHALSASELAAVSALGGTLVAHDVRLGYEQLSMEEVLRALLPGGAGAPPVPASFEVVGHLAHLNLRAEHEAFKYTIGRVLLDKNPALRTVVNKTGAIAAAFRTFPMELLAGEPRTQVALRHVGARFVFDFAAVYWNSRLAHEHERVAAALPPRAVVADLFAGVGPFAVPLAMAPRECLVHANDLNPASHAALLENAARNGAAERVRGYNLDARAFVRALADARVPFEYALMNLPADAVAFLDAFVGLFQGGGGGGGGGDAKPRPLPRILCYAFCKTHTLEDAAADVTRRILGVLRLVPPDEAPFVPPCYDAIGNAVLREQAEHEAAGAAAGAPPPPPPLPEECDVGVDAHAAAEVGLPAAAAATAASTRRCASFCRV